MRFTINKKKTFFFCTFDLRATSDRIVFILFLRESQAIYSRILINWGALDIKHNHNFMQLAWIMIGFPLVSMHCCAVRFNLICELNERIERISQLISGTFYERNQRKKNRLRNESTNYDSHIRRLIFRQLAFTVIGQQSASMIKKMCL